MKRYLGLLLLVLALLCIGTPMRVTAAVGGRGPMGPVKSDRFHTVLVRMQRGAALLYLPERPGPNARVGIVYTAPVALYDFSPAAEMASRGYRVLLVKHYLGDWRGARQAPTDGFAETTSGVAYMRAFPGVERVVVMGHEDGGRMAAFYAAAAELGAAMCQSPELIYPCKQIPNVAKPDGVVLLNPTLGAFDSASAVDPAFEGNRRTKSDLDMYAARNGYDAKTGSAKYSPDFIKRYFAAQSNRSTQIVDSAVARVKIIDQGEGVFVDDEPLTVPGAFNSGPYARLYDADLTLLSHTKAPHDLLKAGGTTANVVVVSTRPAVKVGKVGQLATCCAMVRSTVRRFLANDAIRTTSDFAVTADDIVGVDWKSSNTSTPATAEGITVPTLVMAMGCSLGVVPGEIVYDHLAAKDKTYVAVEGASQDFVPCRPQYEDTNKRTFDFLDAWLAQQGRF